MLYSIRSGVHAPKLGGIDVGSHPPLEIYYTIAIRIVSRCDVRRCLLYSNEVNNVLRCSLYIYGLEVPHLEASIIFAP